jgi:hypothetical protein
MTVLYRGPRGLVTHDVIATTETAWRPVPFATLSAVHIVRTDPEGRALAPRALGVSALVIAVATIPLVGVSSLVVAVLLAIAVVCDVLAARARRATWDLLAYRAGNPAILFSSTDQREFDQLSRAVQRALERRRDDHAI